MHDHHHNHHHHGPDNDSLSLQDKLRKMFAHWSKHNQSHTETYRDWSQKAAAAGMTEIAELLEEIAVMTEEITWKFEQGEKKVP